MPSPVAAAARPARPPGPPPAAGAIAALPPADRALLCALRAALRARRIGAAPTADPMAAAAGALLAALDAGADRAMVFHPGRDASLAFAEAWLLGLVRAVARRDRASAGFLVARCVAEPWRRPIIMAAARLADAAGQTA